MIQFPSTSLAFALTLDHLQGFSFLTWCGYGGEEGRGFQVDCWLDS